MSVKVPGIQKKHVPLYLMILPALILLIIFRYGPITGLILAFKKIIPGKGIFGGDWVGLANFRYVFSLPTIWEVIRNTFIIAFLKIFVGRVMAISLALLLNEVKQRVIKRTVQSIVYLPHFISWVILSGILLDILSPGEGVVNRLIKAAGVDPIYFLGDNQWFRFSMVSTEIWKNMGWSTIIYLAAITSIKPELYESAITDGANRWRQTWHITLPGMMPVIVLTVVLSLGSLLDGGFDQIVNLYNATVYSTGDIIDTLVYRVGLVQANYSLGAAIGLLRSFVSLVFISGSYYLAYKYADYRIF